MAINQTSRLVNSLASFILDTKPFHAKLTAVITEFQFSDEARVATSERLAISAHAKGVWSYPWLSGGDASTPQLTALQRLLRPALREAWRNSDPARSRGAFRAFRDELTDLPLVPLAFDQRSLVGPGLTDAWLERGGLTREPLLEGHDVYLSRGAHVFQVWQTTDSGGAYAPLLQTRQAEGVVAAARAATVAAALDLGNPGSPVNVLTGELSGLKAATAAASGSQPLGAYLAVDAAADDRLAVLATPDLPPDYEVMLGALRALPPAALAALGPGYDDPDALEGRLEAATPSLYFGTYTDLGQREAAGLFYPVVVTDAATAYLTADPAAADYEEWTLVATGPAEFAVTGSASGDAGVAAVGATTALPGGASLTLTAGPSPAAVGETIVLTPGAPVTVHRDAPLEAWSLIKVNPRAYSRPQVNAQGATRLVGLTVLDLAMPATTLTLATADGSTFALSSSAEPSYSGTATVGVPFNDGRLAFTIAAGDGCPPAPGDRLYVEIANEPPVAADAGLYFGYDVDSFDAGSLVYENQNPLDPDHLRTLDFGYGGRFQTYSAASFGLTVGAAAADGRQWRLRALADLSRPIDVLRKDATVGNEVDFTATDPLIALPSYDMPTDVTSEGQRSAYDPDLLPDLRLWYADRFALEWYDEGSSSWVQEAEVPVGGSYSGNGLSFTAAAGDKPFIASQLTSSWYASNAPGPFLSETVDGGDLFAWTVSNPPPVATSTTLAAAGAPRLIMHGGSFQRTPAATWTLAFTDATTATLTGVDAGGATVPPTPATVDLSLGYSYLDDANDVHFTVVPGACGFRAGDTVTFETYARKPSYLVHGSVSGWQPDAALGEWYWNGKIGFKLELPTAELSEGGAPLTHRAEARAGQATDLVDLTGTPTVGGVALAAGDRVLLVGQADASENGLWVAAAGAWTRAPEASTTAGLRLLAVEVTEGDLAGTRWAQTLTVTTVGVSPVSFTQFTSDWYSSYGPVSATLEPSAETATYTLRATGFGARWMLYRGGALVGAGAGSVTDGLVTVTVPAGAPADARLVLQVQADSRALAFAHDQAIVRTDAARAPVDGDYLAFGRAGRDEVAVSVKAQGSAHAAALAALMPASIDPRFVDTAATSGTPLSFTSPETAVLGGWIPLLAADRDGPTSPAVFRDGSRAVDLVAAATGEAVGSIAQGPADDPVTLRWAPDFVAEYLPINAEVTAVTYGSGLVDYVRVRATEDLRFLVGGGSFPSSAMFADGVAVAAPDEVAWRISMSPELAVGVLAEDGPFAGFLQGYDTLRFDFENGHGDEALAYGLGGSYSTDEDLAAALAEAVTSAYALAEGPPADDAQRQQLVTLFAAVAAYLAPGPEVDAAIAAVVDYLEGGPTTLAQAATAASDLLLGAPLAAWLVAIAGSPYVPPAAADAFGVPHRGLGIQVSVPQGEASPVAASAEEAYVLSWADTGAGYALYGYGAGALDAWPTATAVLTLDGVPPVPAGGLPPPLTAWADFETPLEAPAVTRVEVRLGGPLGPTPAVWVWAEDEPAPVQAPEVERLTASSLAVTWPRAVRLKLILA